MDRAEAPRTLRRSAEFWRGVAVLYELWGG